MTASRSSIHQPMWHSIAPQPQMKETKLLGTKLQKDVVMWSRVTRLNSIWVSCTSASTYFLNDSTARPQTLIPSHCSDSRRVDHHDRPSGPDVTPFTRSLRGSGFTKAAHSQTMSLSNTVALRISKHLTDASQNFIPPGVVPFSMPE